MRTGEEESESPPHCHICDRACKSLTTNTRAALSLVRRGWTLPGQLSYVPTCIRGEWGDLFLGRLSPISVAVTLTGAAASLNTSEACAHIGF